MSTEGGKDSGKRKQGRKAKKFTARDAEKAALSGVLNGFNQQSCAMPSIALRFLELDGEPADDIADEAVALYQEAMKRIMDGKDLRVCQLASYYLVAEITLQGIMLAPVPIDGSESLSKNPPPGYQ